MSYFFFFKQKTAYEMRISDWSSDVCSSDLLPAAELADRLFGLLAAARAAHPAFAALVEGFGPLPAMTTDIRKEMRRLIAAVLQASAPHLEPAALQAQATATPQIMRRQEGRRAGNEG